MPDAPRKYIGVMFKCCSIYTRIYINKAGTAYVGRCPKCTAKITLKVGARGKDSRFWAAQ